MAITLFPQQVVACADVDRLYNMGHKNVLCVLPTGVGKTLIKAEYARRNYIVSKMTLIFAHRDVLLGQISRACCLMGVSHSFICAEKTVGQITNNNRAEFGDSFYNEHSNIIVVSVDTFLARLKKGLIPAEFLARVGQWMIDESHHLTRGSKWGQCIEALPNATGLGVTATPIRGDRKGLGFDFDGYFHAMSVTSTMLDSIKAGRLTPYKIMAPTIIDTSGVKKDSDGDYNKNELYIRTKQADITGSAVAHYKKYLDGKPVITFGINIQHCEEIAKEFNDAGIPSRVVSSKSLDSERQNAVADLRNGRLMNLVNCDLFGEGFDAPAVMGVIMLRRTESYSLYKQQFGRMLRSADGKVYGILLDHVGNTRYFMERFKLAQPHDDPEWTLARTDNRKKKVEYDDEDEQIETIRCSKCSAFGIVKPENHVRSADDVGLVFIGGTCPECGWHESDAEREDRKRELKIQAGDLVELSFDIIETLISERNRAMMSVGDFRKSLGQAPFVHAALHNHANRQHALNILRHWIQEWCMMHSQKTGQSVKLVQLDFEIKFGINILKAQAETAGKMTELSAKIQHQVQLMRTPVCS
jgi:superfamily II DNA or RNA helicase